MESKRALKEKIAELERIIEEKDEEIATFEKSSRANMVCSEYCAACENGISYVGSPLGKSYLCSLQSKCKNFKRK